MIKQDRKIFKKNAMAGQNKDPQCCFKECVENPKTKVIASHEGKVECRAFEPKSKARAMTVSWQEGGSAVFHRQCWSMLLKATSGGKSSSALELSDTERSMILEASKTAELHDSDYVMEMNARHVVDILKQSNYAITFTGAGISTAAGIGDFRGKDGRWTNRDKQKNFGVKAGSSSQIKRKNIEAMRPTFTHEAICKLTEMGILKFVISQNTDGLHRLSGVPAEGISELHGDTFIERCELCKHRYERTFGCRRRQTGANVPPNPCKKCRIDHRTGRKCSQPGCDGYLMNTIINFGDYLESNVLRTAEFHAEKADAVLVLGSTLKVSPANDLVRMGQEPNRIIICNRQSTPYDRDCEMLGQDGEKLGSRVFGDCDRLMKLVMQELLSPSDLRQWEKGRKERMIEYDMKRTVVT